MSVVALVITDSRNLVIVLECFTRFAECILLFLWK